MSFWVVPVQHSLAQQGELRTFAVLPSILSGFKNIPVPGLGHGNNIGCIKCEEAFWQLGDQHSESAPLCFCWSCTTHIHSALPPLFFALLCSSVSKTLNYFFPFFLHICFHCVPDSRDLLPCVFKIKHFFDEVLIISSDDKSKSSRTFKRLSLPGTTAISSLLLTISSFPSKWFPATVFVPGLM